MVCGRKRNAFSEDHIGVILPLFLSLCLYLPPHQTRRPSGCSSFWARKRTPSMWPTSCLPSSMRSASRTAKMQSGRKQPGQCPPGGGLLAVIPGHKAPWSFVHCTGSLIPQLSCPFRWLKFEEDVEDGGERWSKPYVATLSLHSLFELRSCIINGSVLLDMHADCIEEIAGSSFFQIPAWDFCIRSKKISSCKICNNFFFY